jgi:phosphoribosylformylglycinamidine cyclo-ligase
MKFVPDGVKVMKDNLFETPYIFEIIKQCSGADWREMMQVFNMGCRLEIFCAEADAHHFIDCARSFGVDARVIGRVEADVKKSLHITHAGETIIFE